MKSSLEETLKTARLGHRLVVTVSVLMFTLEPTSYRLEQLEAEAQSRKAEAEEVLREASQRLGEAEARLKTADEELLRAKGEALKAAETLGVAEKRAVEAKVAREQAVLAAESSKNADIKVRVVKHAFDRAAQQDRAVAQLLFDAPAPVKEVPVREVADEDAHLARLKAEARDLEKVSARAAADAAKKENEARELVRKTEGRNQAAKRRLDAAEEQLELANQGVFEATKGKHEVERVLAMAAADTEAAERNMELTGIAVEANKETPTLSVLGIKMPAPLAAKALPVFLIAILLYVIAHLRRVSNVFDDLSGVREFAWIMLDAAALGRILALVSVVVLPVLGAAYLHFVLFDRWIAWIAAPMAGVIGLWLWLVAQSLARLDAGTSRQPGSRGESGRALRTAIE